MACVTFKVVLASKRESNAWRWATLATWRRSARVSELRIHHGPGYRVYFKQFGDVLVVLLAGGDKSTQAKDIQAALRLARDLA